MSRVVLESERLLLREMSLSDLDFVAGMLAHPEVMRFYARRYSRSEAETWVHNQLARYERDGHGLWLTVDRSSGEPIGQVGLVMQTVDGSPVHEIGYLVHHPFWRRGFASEAAAATRDHAFHELDVERVVSLIRPENHPSQGVARNIGMRPESRTLHAGFDHLVYAISRPQT